MIQCPKCGGDNQIDAIFCRSCGERLNLEDLTPEDIATSAKKEQPKEGGSAAGRAVKLTLLLLLLAILAGLLIPPRQKIGDYETNSAVVNRMQRKMRFLRNGRTPAEGLPLTADELNAFADFHGEFPRELTPAEDENEQQTEGGAEDASADEDSKTPKEPFWKNALTDQDIHVWPLDGEDIDNGGAVKCVLKSMLFNKVPIYITAVFRLAATDEGLQTEVQSAAIGWIPMPGPAADLPLGRFEEIYPDVPTFINDISSYVRSFESTPDGVKVGMK